MTWEVRAVAKTGALVSTVAANVQRVSLGVNGQESATLVVSTLHADATHLDLFENEVQLWLDGGFYTWLTPAALDAERTGQTDELTVECVGLFSYFHDVLVGDALPNLIVSPHLDGALVGAAPASWTATGGVEAAAVVDNNATFWQAPKAIQVNNGTSGEDAYIFQRYTVPAALDRVPMFAGAEVYVADGDGVGGNPPAWGGPAFNGRGLMIHRLDGSTLKPVSTSRVAKIDDDTPRNQVVELFTPGILPRAGEVVEVRLYAPAAWTVWRYAHLRDDRAVSANKVDKSVAVQSLVSHAQDTTAGKYDHSIGTDVVSLGERISMSWPWWRRDNIGEQIEDLADTFEFGMNYNVGATPAVRNLRVRRTVGTDRIATVTLTKVDFVGWGLGMSRRTSAMRVVRQGGGSGAARMEWWAEDEPALNGRVREVLAFGTPGELLAGLRDNAEEQLGRMAMPKLPRARIVGDLAKTIRPGDTVAVNLDHGWAQFVGNARVMKVDLDGSSMVATLDLVPIPAIRATSVSSTLPAPTQSATATHTPPAFTATAASTLPAPTQSATATVT